MCGDWILDQIADFIMSSFTGVSVITEGRHCTTTAVDTGTNSGYHLLVVKDYSRTVQENPNGVGIKCGSFMARGRQFYIGYCPNGEDQSCADFITLCICLGDDNIEEAVKVRIVFSFVDMIEYQNLVWIRATKQHWLSRDDGDCIYWKLVKRDALERSTHLKDDCFTIRCDITVCKDNNTQDVGGSMFDVGQHLDYLLQNKMGVDVTFQISGEVFAAHRCVLASRSMVFMAQLFGPMTEGTTSSVIQIKDMEPKNFRALLSFIYTGLFPDMDKDHNMKEGKPDVAEEGQEEEAVEYVVWLQSLFVAADRYDIQRLKLLCEKKLSEHIGVNSVASTLALAERHHCHELKEACLKFIQVQSIPRLEKVMATSGWELITPSVVKEIIAKVACGQKDNKRKR